MMLIPITNTRNNRDRLSRPSAGKCRLRIDTNLPAIHVQKQFAPPQTASADRSNLDSNAWALAKLTALPTLRVTSAPEPASNSP
jgi:hypothetical protein